MPNTLSRSTMRWASVTVVAAACVTAGSVTATAHAASATGALGSGAVQRSLAGGARFFVPPPSDGAPQQIGQLLKSGDVKDAALIAETEATPRAVWFTS